MVATLEVAHEQSEGRGDFLQQFDFLAGTSVGGCGALLGNQMGST